MSPSWIIAKREIKSFFDSLVAYILLLAFLGFTGFFTWMYGNGDVFFRRQADLGAFFNVAMWTLVFFIPALTMRLLAEERKTGTIELLLTKSVTNWQLVWGKFLAALILVLIALLFTLPYYITVSGLGNFDHGATICGYLGLILLSGAHISIGLFASSLTNNQIVAFLIALVISVTFQFLFNMGSELSGWLGELFTTLSLSNHFDSISRGVIDTSDLIYFASITVLGLLLSEYMISSRK